MRTQNEIGEQLQLSRQKVRRRSGGHASRGLAGERVRRPGLKLDPERRTRVADEILRRLEQAAPGSVAELRGSLTSGATDPYSDIDALWEVPDANFQHCVGNLERILSSVHPVESLRSDPDLQRSAKHRLFFVRLAGLPLFWRLDLEVFARSIE